MSKKLTAGTPPDTQPPKGGLAVSEKKQPKGVIPPSGTATFQEPLAMPVDRESSLFSMTPEQHQRMVEQLRSEFLQAKKLTPKEG